MFNLNNNFQLRRLEARDFSAVRDAYHGQWLSKDDPRKLVANILAAEIFEKATCGSLVYTRDGLTGLAIGKVEGAAKLTLPGDWVSSQSWISEAILPEEQQYLKVIRSIALSNQALLKRACNLGYDFKAELLFLWTGHQARGKGIASFLLKDIERQFRSQGCSSYALFTDNYCKISFYQRHRAFKLLGKQEWREFDSSLDPEDFCLMFAKNIE